MTIYSLDVLLFMAIDGESWKQWQTLFWRLQNDCRWWLQPWIKRCLILGRKVMAILDSILKSRDITLLTNICIVKAVAFPVVMNGCEVWTIKKTEHRRTDAFQLCFGDDSWSTRRSNQSTLKKIFPEYSLEGPILWPHDVKNWFIG